MPHSKNFTLIELLIVVSIIAILLSILLPSLKTARDKARSIHCISNLKNYGHLMVLYMNDYQLVPAAQGKDDEGNPVYWNETLRNYTGTPITTAKKAGSAWFCPSYGKITFHYNAWTGYGMNSYLPPSKKGDILSDARSRYPVLERVKQPTITPLLADQFEDWHISSGSYIKPGALLFHNLNINTLFVDGHAASHKKSYLTAMVALHFTLNGSW